MTIVMTTAGPIRGSVRDGVRSFLGVPYAASPTGDLRFAAPSAPVPWTEERPAIHYGATPPKPPYAPPIDAILVETEYPGDDYLNVNVWAPEAGAEGRPVFVWIHGGAFVNGNNTIPVYDGHAFARDGVVCVGVNYRLGVDGFAYLPDAPAPANRGLLDQIAALEWVRDNIAAFGGDPANVTIAGESAGAMSVTSLLAMPRAAGLFAKAVTESGSVQAAASIGDAMKVTAELNAVAGAADLAGLAALDIADLLVAQRAVSVGLAIEPDPARYGMSIVASSMAFIPVVDGDTLPTHPMAAIAGGATAGVPLLTGTTTDEHRLFLVPTGIAANTVDEAVDAITARLGAPAGLADVYRANRPDATPGDVLAALLTDAFFRNPAFAVAAARAGSPTYVYEFAWPTETYDLRACHGLEIAFVFDTITAEHAAALAGPNPPQHVADSMHAAWVAFARTGDPGWEAFNDSYPVMVFSADGPTLVHDPRGDERKAWSAA
jgi:para-nitrobenzyl esterase